MSTFQIASSAIDLTSFRETLLDTSCGAFVEFEGWVRDHNEGQQVLRLEYEVYAPLAIKEGQRVITEAIDKFGITNAFGIHRSGLLELTDVAVVVGVSSPHRGAAFDACRYIIDEVKQRLPIWKKEYYASGLTEWVNCQQCAHPHSSPTP